MLIRGFGLEQFLHVPRVTMDKESNLVAFMPMTGLLRKDNLIKYADV